MNRETIKYLIANTIYGTIGLFLHFVNTSSEFVVLCRGIIGSLFIILMKVLNKDYLDSKSIRSNLKLLVISGMALGLNWVFLFAGYRYAVAITSLCNYMAPIIIVLISSLLFKEKINNKQKLCVFLAFVGIILVSGVLNNNSLIDYHCVIYGLLAALGFVILVLCNRRLKDIKPLDKTVIQLFVSALTVLPYVIINNGFPSYLDVRSIILLIVMGVVHTGIAYILYFNSIDVLPVHKVAVLGYIEPVLSVLIGALVFNEYLGIAGIIGAILIIFSALFNEISSLNNNN